jgi:3-methylfumaryl-CoA hydratase
MNEPMAALEIENAPASSIEEADDVCALPLVRRLGATLDIDPGRWREGDPLPRGWHLAFFTVDTRQSQLRPDGVAGLGVRLPDIGLPRIMVAGRRIRFNGDISIGSHLRRVSRLLSVVPKEGRSGRFALTTAQHEIFAGDSRVPAVVELMDHVMREPAAPAPSGEAAEAIPPHGPAMPAPERRRVVTPDETLLFRVSAIMFNPHRIHYDLPYATGKEGYPALVVNGSVSSLLLLEFFRTEAGREPESIALRNVGPAFCGRPLRLNAIPGDKEWRVWADDEDGRVAVEGTMG